MSAIKKGDFVRVAYGCGCGCQDRVGVIFMVDEVRLAAPEGYCRVCDATFMRKRGEMVALGLRDPVNTIRLIKLDPPAIRESTETDLALTV